MCMVCVYGSSFRSMLHMFLHNPRILENKLIYAETDIAFFILSFLPLSFSSVFSLPHFPFLSACWVSLYACQVSKQTKWRDVGGIERGKERKIWKLKKRSAGGCHMQRGEIKEGEEHRRDPNFYYPPAPPPLLYGRAECRSVLAYSHQQQSVLPQLLTHLAD